MSATKFFLFFFAASMSAHADLLMVDHPILGHGSLIRDTVSSLEWVDIPLTYGIEITPETLTDGQFAGFKVASWEQVLNLFGSHSTPSLGGGESVFADSTYVFQVLSLVGAPAVVMGGAVDNPSLVGYFLSGYATQAPTYNHNTTIFYRTPNAYNGFTEPLAYATWGTWASFSPSGTWLVRDVVSTIPEPSMFGLYVVGLLVLRRRRLESANTSI